MGGFGTFPALLPRLAAEWSLSGGEAGAIAGAYFAGYMLAVPWLSSLTDRIDARRVFAGGCLVSAAGSAAFALLATGPMSGCVFQAVAGAGLAGTYMPGLKALTDRVSGARQSRYVAFYTSTFGIGTSLSLAASGWIAGAAPWRWAFAAAAVGPLAAALLVTLFLAPREPRPAGAAFIGGQLALLRDRRVLGYVLGYGVHCWELFGLRSWMVGFLAFAYGLHAGGAGLPEPASSAAAINLVGIPASILGNELAQRVDRRRYILAVMAASGTLAWAVGFAPALATTLTLALLTLYYFAVMADSAALTAGLVAAAPPAQRGAALAVYSLVGFGAGFVGPLAFGLVLDAAGGRESALAWGLATASLGFGCLLAPLVSRRGRKPTHL